MHLLHNILINKRIYNQAIVHKNNVLQRWLAVINFFAKIDHNSFESDTFVSPIHDINA